MVSHVQAASGLVGKECKINRYDEVNITLYFLFRISPAERPSSQKYDNILEHNNAQNAKKQVVAPPSGGGHSAGVSSPSRARIVQ